MTDLKTKNICQSASLECANAATPFFASNGKLLLAWTAGGVVSVAQSSDLGKSFSPEQAWVDNAIRYAAEKDVLIIHSAGNEYYDLDNKAVYPNPYSSSLKDTAKNVVTVAASSDPFINETLLTDFSNFGPRVVDILSPGNKIYSTLPGATNHGYLQGTSMAAPIVSHIAAMIRSYYPSLSAVDVKKILMQTVWKPADTNFSYPVPQKEETKKLSEIAKAAGIVNAANAIELANTYKTNNKSKNKTTSSN